VLGAGFDTLAPRLAAERPEIGSFELDHPATQSEKITGLRAIGAIRPNLNLLSCDLSSEDPDRVLLAHPAFLRSAPSYVVLEGLLMYLDRDQVDRLFARVLQVTQPTSRIALTFIETRDDGSPLLGPWGKALEWRLRRAGEPFRWGVTRNDLAAYLESRDLKLIDAPDKTELRRRYLQGLDDRRLLSWEHVAVAERR
jgi:methyltransferase (TIGR00027 family)